MPRRSGDRGAVDAAVNRRLPLNSDNSGPPTSTGAAAKAPRSPVRSAPSCSCSPAGPPLSNNRRRGGGRPPLQRDTTCVDGRHRRQRMTTLRISRLGSGLSCRSPGVTPPADRWSECVGIRVRPDQCDGLPCVGQGGGSLEPCPVFPTLVAVAQPVAPTRASAAARPSATGQAGQLVMPPPRARRVDYLNASTMPPAR